MGLGLNANDQEYHADVFIETTPAASTNELNFYFN